MAKAKMKQTPLHLRPARGFPPAGYVWAQRNYADEDEATREFGEFEDLSLAYTSLLRAKVYIEMARENTAA